MVWKAIPPETSEAMDSKSTCAPDGPSEKVMPEVSQNRVAVVISPSWGASMKASASTPDPSPVIRGSPTRPTSIPL